MGTRYLLDTNTVIYYINEALPISALNFLDTELDKEANLSIISKIELLSWQPPTDKSLKPIKDFIDLSIVLPLTDAIVQKTIEIRRLKKLKLPDAVIAATALVNDFTLISRNKSDFSNIAGITCLDPFTDF